MPQHDEFAKHEVLHMASFFQDAFNQHLREHHVVEADEELDKEAEKVSQALHDFYQLCGQKFL